MPDVIGVDRAQRRRKDLVLVGHLVFDRQRAPAVEARRRGRKTTMAKTAADDGAVTSHIVTNVKPMSLTPSRSDFYNPINYLRSAGRFGVGDWSIPMFGSIGMPELIIILVIALIIFGPRKLPELGQSLGRSINEFKKASTELQKHARGGDQRRGAEGPDDGAAPAAPTPPTAAARRRDGEPRAPASRRTPERTRRRLRWPWFRFQARGEAGSPAHDLDPDPDFTTAGNRSCAPSRFRIRRRTTKTTRRGEMSFLEHLDELRKRITHAAISICRRLPDRVRSSITQLFEFVMQPLQATLPAGSQLIYTEPTEAFVPPSARSRRSRACVRRVCRYVMPQVWLFVAPGLYANEKKMAIPFVVMSTVFFVIGAAFSHYVVFPLTWKFFVELHDATT